MTKTSPLVITISRQLGSGGSYVGQKLANNLNIFYADREIIHEAAKRLSVLEEVLESRNEKILSFWQSFLQLCTYASNTYAPPTIIAPTDRELFKTETEIIERIAKERSAVIIGRCGSHVLCKHPNHVSIFLHGDIYFRKVRVQKLYNVSEEVARKMIIQNDKERAQYNHACTGKEWTDARQYDISMDTSKIGLDESLEIIMKYLALIKERV